jgi:hypothetical protein
VSVSADLRLNQPIVRVVVCCARAESGSQACKKFPPLMFAPGSGANIVLVKRVL